jgi:hypothetical protein
MKAIKKIFNVKAYLKSQSMAKKHVANVSKNKGDRVLIPIFKASKIKLNEKQDAEVQSWFKPTPGYTALKK